MAFEKFVEKQIEKSSYEGDRKKIQLGRLYSVMRVLCAVVASDTRDVFRAFFPALGTRTFMDRHAKALALPHIKNESDKSLRDRLTVATHTMTYLGTRQAFTQFMESNFKSRCRVIEMPKNAFTVGHLPYGTPIGTGIIMAGEGLYVYVQNITAEERIELESYLETNTPPDVGFVIFNENTKKSHTNTGDRNL